MLPPTAPYSPDFTPIEQAFSKIKGRSAPASVPAPRRHSGRPCGWQLRRSLTRMRRHGLPMLVTPCLLKIPESCSRGCLRRAQKLLGLVAWAAGGAVRPRRREVPDESSSLS